MGFALSVGVGFACFGAVDDPQNRRRACRPVAQQLVVVRVFRLFPAQCAFPCRIFACFYYFSHHNTALRTLAPSSWPSAASNTTPSRGGTLGARCLLFFLYVSPLYWGVSLSWCMCVSMPMHYSPLRCAPLIRNSQNRCLTVFCSVLFCSVWDPFCRRWFCPPVKTPLPTARRRRRSWTKPSGVSLCLLVSLSLLPLSVTFCLFVCSGKNWGASSTLLNDLARLTFDYTE